MRFHEQKEDVQDSCHIECIQQTFICSFCVVVNITLMALKVRGEEGEDEVRGAGAEKGNIIQIFVSPEDALNHE